MADEEARAQAEARRQRILAKANQRIGLVSGEQVLDETTKEESARQAARIKAARQRRYGSKKKVTSTTPGDDVGGSGMAEDGHPQDNNDPKAAVEGRAIPMETTATNETPAKSIAGQETAEDAESKPTMGEQQTVSPKVLVVQAPTEVQQTVDSKHLDGGESVAASMADESVGTTETSGSKKKYMGVAKMRRQMIMKKKQQEGATRSSETRASSAVASKVHKTKPLIKKLAVLPVYMHILTVLLVFFAGVDVGFQTYQEDVIIHSDNVISQFGLPLIHRSLWGGPKRQQRLHKLNGLEGSDVDGASEFPHDEEFVEIEEAYVPNIDPIFRVDLDELTMGPGMLNQLARGAVAVHRFLLRLFLYTPLSIIETTLSLPTALWKHPPLLCILALLLRQVVGKAVLGADIPAALEGDKAKPKVDDSIDIMNMAKNMVFNFLSTAFPTAVGLYNALTHLRSDMYILLCGVFCGLAWSSYAHQQLMLPADVLEKSSVTNEDWSASSPPPSLQDSVVGGADEL